MTDVTWPAETYRRLEQTVACIAQTNGILRGVAAEDARRGPYCNGNHGNRGPQSLFSQPGLAVPAFPNSVNISATPSIVGRLTKSERMKPRRRNSASDLFSTGQSRQLQHKFNLQEGINHGYKATEYPDSVG
jgi:hypothetical protein